jgi:hypothetical protein
MHEKINMAGRDLAAQLDVRPPALHRYIDVIIVPDEHLEGDGPPCSAMPANSAARGSSQSASAHAIAPVDRALTAVATRIEDADARLGAALAAFARAGLNRQSLR